ncbi:unnamed protein product [Closterium sp. Yama58-4]|nr:unnamed protein product [Closterium sp. Yama58-4]
MATPTPHHLTHSHASLLCYSLPSPSSSPHHQVRNAAVCGAIAAIIYSDPADYGSTALYPSGPGLPPSGAQVSFLLSLLSPGYVCRDTIHMSLGRYAHVASPSPSPSFSRLPHIPSLPSSHPSPAPPSSAFLLPKQRGSIYESLGDPQTPGWPAAQSTSLSATHRRQAGRPARAASACPYPRQPAAVRCILRRLKMHLTASGCPCPRRRAACRPSPPCPPSPPCRPSPPCPPSPPCRPSPPCPPSPLLLSPPPNQRGSIYESLGDPQTPGWPSRPGGERLSLSEAAGSLPPIPALPSIPAVPLSYGQANFVLEQLGGAAAPEEWIGDIEGLEYHVGPGPVVVEMEIEVSERRRGGGGREIRGVLLLGGAAAPEEWIGDIEGLEYHVGPGPVVVEMEIELLAGAAAPEEWIGDIEGLEYHIGPGPVVVEMEIEVRNDMILLVQVAGVEGGRGIRGVLLLLGGAAAPEEWIGDIEGLECHIGPGPVVVEMEIEVRMWCGGGRERGEDEGRAEANFILEQLGGAAALEEWIGDIEGLEYHIGPGPVVVEMEIEVRCLEESVGRIGKGNTDSEGR